MKQRIQSFKFNKPTVVAILVRSALGITYKQPILATVNFTDGTVHQKFMER